MFYNSKKKGNLLIKNGVYVSDFNEDLINFFKIIQEAPVGFYSTFLNMFVLPYRSLENSDAQANFFYDVRANFNHNSGAFNTLQSARFFFLNKTCYGGLFRMNSSGFFNVPFGRRKNLSFLTEASLLEISKLIKNVNFSHESFSHNTEEYEKGDFFYFDPPYVKTTKTSYVNYLSSSFLDDDFFLLSNFCKKLDRSGCFFTLSNSTDHKVSTFAKNYKTLHYSTNSLKGYSMNQLLITNSPNKLN